MTASTEVTADGLDKRAVQHGRSAAEFALEDLLELYTRMSRIRAFEDRAAALYRDGEIPGFLHTSVGQEATAVGMCWALRDGDYMASTHRGHGHCLARGMAPGPMFAELFGRATGTCHGRGGSMHIADPALGVLGANGIVAAGLPIAVGAATASRIRASGEVTVAFFGDGAVAQGMFHEALNLAAVWRLPVIFFCENNHYAEFSPERAQHPVPISERSKAYGIRAVTLDGSDVAAIASVMTTEVERVRADGGPILVEADTYRFRGHYEGDPERYRDASEVQRERERDPLLVLAKQLAEREVSVEALTAVDDEARRWVDEAITWARSQPEPEPSSLFDFVVAARPSVEETWSSGGSGDYRVMDAIRDALVGEMEEDERVYIAGIDVGPGGNVFGLTRGLHARWPERVRDTPISETVIVGSGVGAAMAGMVPVVEIMYLDFIGVCLDALLNQAAKMRFMTGGAASVPLTVRTQFGAGRSSGAQHSQSLEALLAHIPGLTVVMPSTAGDAYGLLRTAIQDPNPVIFIEHRLLYGHKSARPPADHRVPIGRARVVRQGTDVTVVSVSRMVHESMVAADKAAADGIEAEVIDLRTVAPLDHATVLESVAKTNRLIVAHEAVTDFGIGAEIAARAADEGFWDLDAPIRRVGAEPMPAPYSPSLERLWLPDAERILAAIREVAAI